MKYKLIGEIFPMGCEFDGGTIVKTIFEGTLEEIKELIIKKINEGILYIDCHKNLVSNKIKEHNVLYIQKEGSMKTIDPVKEFNLIKFYWKGK